MIFGDDGQDALAPGQAEHANARKRRRAHADAASLVLIASPNGLWRDCDAARTLMAAGDVDTGGGRAAFAVLGACVATWRFLPATSACPSSWRPFLVASARGHARIYGCSNARLVFQGSLLEPSSA